MQRSPDRTSSARILAAADYARAEQLLSCHADPLVLHEPEPPTWLPSGKFWYRTRTAKGFTFVLIDPLRNTRQAVFDEEQVALSLTRAEGEQYNGGGLPFDAFELSADEKRISFQIGSKRWQCKTDGRNLLSLPPSDPDAVRSPDGKREVFIRNDNLWLREIATGNERPLTTDGLESFGYATDNSGRKHTSRPCVLWSPNSRRIATFQQDGIVLGGVTGPGELAVRLHNQYWEKMWEGWKGTPVDYKGS